MSQTSILKSIKGKWIVMYFQGIIPSIGGGEDRVKELYVDDNRLESAVNEAKLLPQLAISDVDLQWVQVLAEGWAAPLQGFMIEDQYLKVCMCCCSYLFVVTMSRVSQT